MRDILRWEESGGIVLKARYPSSHLLLHICRGLFYAEHCTQIRSAPLLKSILSWKIHNQGLARNHRRAWLISVDMSFGTKEDALARDLPALSVSKTMEADKLPYYRVHQSSQDCLYSKLVHMPTSSTSDVLLISYPKWLLLLASRPCEREPPYITSEIEECQTLQRSTVRKRAAPSRSIGTATCSVHASEGSACPKTPRARITKPFSRRLKISPLVLA
jgi:hypothetical protein